MRFKIEAKLNAKSLGLKTISQLNKDFAHQLVLSDQADMVHRDKMKAHKDKLAKTGSKVATTHHDTHSLHQTHTVSPGVASVKAPTDPQKLMLVQLNNQKPESKRPPSSALMQTDQELSKKSKAKAKVLEPVTIKQGMQLTGGYKGTDLDSENLSLQIQANMDKIQAERLVELKRERRLYREKILCADNCQLNKWTFMTGIQLSTACPIDCPENELNGQMKFKTSIAALEAYNSYFSIRDLEMNKTELE